MNDGYCACGCGGKTSLVKQNDASKGLVAGTYRKWLKGHSTRAEGSFSPRRAGSFGYVLALSPGHDRTGSGNHAYEHVLIAERALGKPLDKRHPVHHVNGVRDDNRPENLVVCEDHAFHMLLHRRQKALDACGNPGWLKCCFCKEWDAPENLQVFGAKTGSQARHRACSAEYERRKYREKNGVPESSFRPNRIESAKRGRARQAMEKKRSQTTDL